MCSPKKDQRRDQRQLAIETYRLASSSTSFVTSELVQVEKYTAFSGVVLENTRIDIACTSIPDLLKQVMTALEADDICSCFQLNLSKLLFQCSFENVFWNISVISQSDLDNKYIVEMQYRKGDRSKFFRIWRLFHQLMKDVPRIPPTATIGILHDHVIMLTSASNAEYLHNVASEYMDMRYEALCAIHLASQTFENGQLLINEGTLQAVLNSRIAPNPNNNLCNLMLIQMLTKIATYQQPQDIFTNQHKASIEDLLTYMVNTLHMTQPYQIIVLELQRQICQALVALAHNSYLLPVVTTHTASLMKSLESHKTSECMWLKRAAQNAHDALVDSI